MPSRRREGVRFLSAGAFAWTGQPRALSVKSIIFSSRLRSVPALCRRDFFAPVSEWFPVCPPGSSAVWRIFVLFLPLRERRLVPLPRKIPGGDWMSRGGSLFWMYREFCVLRHSERVECSALRAVFGPLAGSGGGIRAFDSARSGAACWPAAGRFGRFGGMWSR